MKIYEIIWTDSESLLTTMDVKSAIEYFSPKQIRSVGYLVFENKQFILLAFVKIGENIYKNWQCIQKSTIVKQKELKS